MANRFTVGVPITGPSDTIREQICEAAEKGLSISSCAAAADISRRTLQSWLTRGRRALEAAGDGAEITHAELVYASVAEEFDRARARGVMFLEEVSTRRAEKGLGTWSEAVTKLERGHRDEWGRQPDTVQMGGQVTLVIEGRPPRDELTPAAQEVLEANGGTPDRRELPAAPTPSSVPE